MARTWWNASHACQSSSGTSPSRRAAVSTAAGWRTTTSSNAPSGAPRASSHAGPVEPGGQRLERGQGVLVVGLERVAAVDGRPVALGQRRLQRHDPGGGAVGVGLVDQAQHGGDVLDVGGPDLGVGVLAVVRLVGQAEAALHQVDDVAGGVLAVVVDEPLDQARACRGAAAGRAGPPARRWIGHGADGGQVVGQRLGVARLDAVDVHERGPQVADLALVAAGRGVAAPPPPRRGPARRARPGRAACGTPRGRPGRAGSRWSASQRLLTWRNRSSWGRTSSDSSSIAIPLGVLGAIRAASVLLLGPARSVSLRGASVHGSAGCRARWSGAKCPRVDCDERASAGLSPWDRSARP